jgi:hypothetical protein
MQNVQKQMEDYGADLDGIKRKLVDNDRAVATSHREAWPPRGGLVNNGLPLLDTPQTSAA